jgi:hypothetical protein
MDLLNTLAVAEATKIKDLVKRVNIADYSYFISKNVFIPKCGMEAIQQALKHEKQCMYVVIGVFGVIEFVSESYEEAIRYALTNFIHSIDFNEK